MNARTIYRRLMRNRTNVFWGRRAYLCVYVPYALYPEPPPPEFLSLPEVKARHMVGGAFQGYFDATVPGEDGLFEIWRIGHWTTGQPLTDEAKAELAADRNCTLYGYSEEPTTSGRGLSVSWWEASSLRERRLLNEKGEKAWEYPFEPIPLEESIVRAYVREKTWIRTFVETLDPRPILDVPALAALDEAGQWARARYASLDNEHQRVRIDFAVKYFYRNRARGFAANVKRACELAEKAGARLTVGH